MTVSTPWCLNRCTYLFILLWFHWLAFLFVFNCHFFPKMNIYKINVFFTYKILVIKGKIQGKKIKYVFFALRVCYPIRLIRIRNLGNPKCNRFTQMCILNQNTDFKHNATSHNVVCFQPWSLAHKGSQYSIRHMMSKNVILITNNLVAYLRDNYYNRTGCVNTDSIS